MESDQDNVVLTISLQPYTPLNTSQLVAAGQQTALQLATSPGYIPAAAMTGLHTAAAGGVAGAHPAIPSTPAISGLTSAIVTSTTGENEQAWKYFHFKCYSDTDREYSCN